jgi:hypothetical protein
MTEPTLSVDLTEIKPDIFPMLLDVKHHILEEVQKKFQTSSSQDHVLYTRIILMNELRELVDKIMDDDDQNQEDDEECPGYE